MQVSLLLANSALGLALTFFILSACQPAANRQQPTAPQIQPTPSLGPPFTPTAEEISLPTSIPAGRAILTPTIQAESLPLTRYTITASLNYAQHSLSVDELIQYVNRSSEPLNDIRLMIDSLYYPGVFRLSELRWDENQAVNGYVFDGAQMLIPLRQPLAPGESLQLAMKYELSLPASNPSPDMRPIPFGYTSRQTNLVDWYPFIPPYESGRGWLAHKAGFFGEHLVYEAADFDVSIQITDNRPDLTLAASAPAIQDGIWRRYQLRSARNFAWSVSHEYQVNQITVGEVSILSYAFTGHEMAGQAALQTTADALALYNEIYGPYPRETLSLVEADFLDGMEYDGLYFLSNGFYNIYQGTPGEYLVAIAAHETAHQWFYGLVGNDQALEPWLDEALCTYSERIFFERYYPDALDWWWNYRVNYYQPRGYVNGSIYNPEGYRAYRDAVYLNGAVFLEALRVEIGDEAFFAFLKDYLRTYANTIARADDFFTELQRYTDLDLSGLKELFFLKVN